MPAWPARTSGCSLPGARRGARSRRARSIHYTGSASPAAQPSVPTSGQPDCDARRQSVRMCPQGHLGMRTRTRVSRTGPGENCGQDDSAAVDEYVFVVAGGQCAPLPEQGEGALDDVALLELAVVADRSTALAAAAGAV